MGMMISCALIRVLNLDSLQVTDHQKWLDDVVAHCENKVGPAISFAVQALPRLVILRSAPAVTDSCVRAQITVDFPIIGDYSREISVK